MFLLAFHWILRSHVEAEMPFPRRLPRLAFGGECPLQVAIVRDFFHEEEILATRRVLSDSSLWLRDTFRYKTFGLVRGLQTRHPITVWNTSINYVVSSITVRHDHDDIGTFENDETFTHSFTRSRKFVLSQCIADLRLRKISQNSPKTNKPLEPCR